MNRPALHRTGLLSALLLLSVLMVPVNHALRHSDGAADGILAGPSVEAWCDYCHQPFVAFTAETPVLLKSGHAGPVYVAAAPAPGPAATPGSEPRGPPVAV